MGPKNVIFTVVIAAALAAGAFVAIRSQAPVAPSTATVLPAPAPTPEFSLLNQRGEPVNQTVFEGQWDLVFFGFTHCPDICPATLQVLAAARKSLVEKGRKTLPRIVLVSVDPERDTPELMGQYVDYFGAGNLGLTGTLEEVRKLTDGLGIYFEKHDGSADDDTDDYVVDHAAAVLVLDPNGGFHSLFSGPHVIENYVHDLPILMGGK